MHLLSVGDIDEDNNTNSVQNETINNNNLGGTGHAEDHTSGSTNIDHHVGIPEGDLEHHQTINAHTTAETDHLPISVERRSRQPPVWLCDYDSGEGFSNEDHQGNFALFIDADPLSYEDAARSYKWRCAMETEIATIKKNNTWTSQIFLMVQQ